MGRFDMKENQPADSSESEFKDSGRDDNSRLGFFELFGRIKPPQFLAAVMVFSTFLGGAFGYGYKFGIQSARSKMTKTEATIAPTESETQLVRGSQAKEQFLAIYLRYFIAKETYAKYKSKENHTFLESTRSRLGSFIEKLIAPKEKASEETGSVKLLYAETNGRRAMIKFNDDGSVWPLDPDIGFVSEIR